MPETTKVPAPTRTVCYADGRDLDASREFYTEVLGFDPTMEDPVLGLASQANPRAQVLIAPPGFESPQPRFGVDVGDPAAVDAAHAAALERGLRVAYPLTDEPWGVRRFFVEDPGGTIVNVLAHTTPAGAGAARAPADPSLSLPLSTERLRLRAHRPDDAGWLHRIYSRPEVARYLLDEPWTPADAAAKATRRARHTDLDGETGTLSLVVELDGEGIGDVTLWLTDRERRVAEIGWVLDPDAAGRGYAREAARAVLGLAFDHYALHRVVAQMDARNNASARLAQAVGMHQEAHHRQHWWSKNEWTDTLVFASLSTDDRPS